MHQDVYESLTQNSRLRKVSYVVCVDQLEHVTDELAVLRRGPCLDSNLLCSQLPSASIF